MALETIKLLDGETPEQMRERMESLMPKKEDEKDNSYHYLPKHVSSLMGRIDPVDDSERQKRRHVHEARKFLVFLADNMDNVDGFTAEEAKRLWNSPSFSSKKEQKEEYVANLVDRGLTREEAGGIWDRDDKYKELFLKVYLKEKFMSLSKKSRQDEEYVEREMSRATASAEKRWGKGSKHRRTNLKTTYFKILLKKGFLEFDPETKRYSILKMP
jgi:hypothetical protein